MILPRGHRRDQNTRRQSFRYADAPPDFPIGSYERVEFRAHLIPWEDLSEAVKATYIDGWRQALMFLDGDALRTRVREIYTKIQRSEQNFVDILNPPPRFFHVLRTEHLKLTRPKLVAKCSLARCDIPLLTQLETWGVSHIRPGESFFGATWYRLHYLHKFLCRGLGLHIKLTEFGKPYTEDLHRLVASRQPLPDWVYYTFRSDLRYVRGDAVVVEEDRCARTTHKLSLEGRMPGPTLEFFESTF
jgi:hypothetical protein